MSNMTSTPKELGKLTVAELKDELQTRGLSVTGRKQDLVERLKASKDAAVVLIDDNEEVEDTLVSQDDVSQLDEDIAVLAQEEYDNNTTEDTAFVTAVDDSGNLAEHLEEAEATMQQDIDESGSQEKDSAVLVKERDDAMSKADSLTVNLDQDIASLGDLEEKQGSEDSIVESADGKSFNKTEVVIDAVGEVDDAEFGAVVASMEENTDDTKIEVKKGSTEKKEEKAEEKSKKEYPPLPSQPMSNWMVKQFAIAKRFSCLYIRPLSAVDILGEAVVEWANRAVYFCINHERDGKGIAVLNFITEKECKEAKESLTASLGDIVKVLHPSRDMEDEIKQAACYKVECPNLVTRTLILEDAPPGITEDQVCLLFPGAISVSRPECKETYYEWQKQRFSLPESIRKIFVIEFGNPKSASKALAEEYELEDQKLKLVTMQTYQKKYRDYCYKKAEEERLQRKAEAEKQRREREKKAMEQVFSDEERIELCKALKEIVSKRSFVTKRNDLPWHDKMMQKEKLTHKLMDIVRALDADSDKRVKLGMGFPESEKLMTRNTKKMFQRNPKLRKASEPKDSSKSQKKSDVKKDLEVKDVNKDLSLKITVSTGEETKREVEKSEKDVIVKKEDEKEAADDVVVIVSKETKTVEEIEIKDDDSEEVKEAQETMAREEHELVEGADMEMGEENAEDKEKDEKEEDILSEVLEEVFASKSEDAKKSRHSPKKDEKKETKKEEEKHDRKDGKDARRKRTHSSRDSEQLRQMLAKLEEDKRGWWSIAQERKNMSLARGDYERLYKKFGKVMEVHITDKKVFLRFGSRGAASSAVREHWGSSRNITIPPVLKLWQKTGDSIESRFRLREDRGRNSSSRDRNRDLGSRDRRGSKEIPSLLTSNAPRNTAFQANTAPLAVQLQQQVQQQMMMQQQLQQQQQMALLQLQQQQQQEKFKSHQSIAGGLLGSAPQPLLSSGNSRSGGGGRTIGDSSGGIPSLFGVTGVPPVRRHSPDRDTGFGKVRRRSLSPLRGRSPPRKVLLGSAFDAKRPRLDDDYDFRGNDIRGFSSDTDRMASSSNPANPVADMLKGLSNVISSKMEEISRIGGTAAGEQAVSDVMYSINSMQKNLLPAHNDPPRSSSSSFSCLGGGGGGGGGLGDSSYGSLGGLSSSYGSGGSSSRLGSATTGGFSSQLGGGTSGSGGTLSRGGGGSYGNSQRMYSKFSDNGSSSSTGLGRSSSQVLDYAHQSRKGLLNPPNY